jgi:predicted metal-dependent peptidase
MSGLDRRHVAAARLWAANKFPYLASALFAAEVIERDGIGGDGIAVDDRWRLYVEPDRAASWTVPELGALLVHHTGHLVRDHAARARSLGVSGPSAERWCNAADAELNDDLADVGLSMPGKAILPEDLGFERGRLAEEYFHLQLGDPPPTEQPASDHGSGAHGQDREWEDPGGDGDDTSPASGDGLSRHESDLLRSKTAQDILAAVRNGQGNVPGNWRRWAEQLLAPSVDWRRALSAEVRRGVQSIAGAVDYSYRRPSRRASVSPTIVLPALEQPVPEVAIVCDTSGSMGGAELARVLAEVEGLLASIGLRSAGCRVLAVDTTVQTVRRVSSARQVELVGGGGTDMARGIDAAAALRPRPSVLVVLTDGMTPWPPVAPRGMRVVIGLLVAPGAGVRPSPPTPHWARVVRIDDAA